jgi:glycine reductase
MLRVVSHPVHSVSAGRASYDDGRLSVDVAALGRLVEKDPRIAEVSFHFVRPGDRTRVADVLDIFDARRKVEGPTYPGFDGPPVPAGSGELHKFTGFQIVGTAKVPSGGGGVRTARRAFLDFWGEGARWSPFAASNSMIVQVILDPALEDQGAADDAIRRALITVSTEVGGAGLDATSSTPVIEEWPSSWEQEVNRELPRVAYVYQVQSHGALLDTYLYGQPADGLYPTLLEPAEIIDGALVSGNRGRVTTPTILHGNNPVIRRLAAEHGKTLTLLPVVLTEGHQKSTPAKERSAHHATQLLRMLQAQGMVHTQEGGGMSIVDQMLTIEHARACNIECVAVTYEMAGTEGTDRSLIYYTRAARNLVSTGNRDELVQLEAPQELVESTLNGDGTTSAPTPAADGERVLPHQLSRVSTETSERIELGRAINVPVWCLYGAVAQVGAGVVRAGSSSPGVQEAGATS